jgi:hypothetical protein
VNRDLGLTRARTVTIGLAGVTLVGVVTVAGLARHDTDTGTQAATSNSTGSSSASTGSNSGSTSTDDGSSNTFPNLGGHADSGGSGGSGGAATSGGS